ncbi:MAG: DUF3107 family protein [Actinomycetes bacterium]|jgi:hypothetical protein|nr:MAG: DUF3107 domain-containing protein [Actinomycetota bacterium]
MKVRIGVSHTDKLIELEIDDVDVFKQQMESAMQSGGLAWFTDSKGRSVAITVANIAFVEIEDAPQRTVGFAVGK